MSDESKRETFEYSKFERESYDEVMGLSMDLLALSNVLGGVLCDMLLKTASARLAWLADKYLREDQIRCDKASESPSEPQGAIPEDAPDMVNQPPHYKARAKESIDEMLAVFGPKATFDFCICNAWKYRYRAPYKGKQEEDDAKSDWYVQMAETIHEDYSLDW
jgi:hypothetical protein